MVINERIDYFSDFRIKTWRGVGGILHQGRKDRRLVRLHNKNGTGLIDTAGLHWLIRSLAR
jgi:hypothetical protein